MPLLKALVASLFRARGVPLPPEWRPERAARALFLLAGTQRTLLPLLEAVRARCEATHFAALTALPGEPLQGFDETYILPRSLAARLALARRLGRLRLDVCFVPMTGEGGWWLKAVGFLSAPRTLVLCPSPEHWFRYRPLSEMLRRPLRPLLRLLLMPATAVLVAVRAGYVLLCCWLRRGASRALRGDEVGRQSRLKP